MEIDEHLKYTLCVSIHPNAESMAPSLTPPLPACNSTPAREPASPWSRAGRPTTSCNRRKEPEEHKKRRQGNRARHEKNPATQRRKRKRKTNPFHTQTNPFSASPQPPNPRVSTTRKKKDLPSSSHDRTCFANHVPGERRLGAGRENISSVVPYICAGGLGKAAVNLGPLLSFVLSILLFVQSGWAGLEVTLGLA